MSLFPLCTERLHGARCFISSPYTCTCLHRDIINFLVLYLLLISLWKAYFGSILRQRMMAQRKIGGPPFVQVITHPYQEHESAIKEEKAERPGPFTFLPLLSLTGFPVWRTWNAFLFLNFFFFILPTLVESWQTLDNAFNLLGSAFFPRSKVLVLDRLHDKKEWFLIRRAANKGIDDIPESKSSVPDAPPDASP